MVPLYVSKPYIQLYAFCKDDSLPSFKPNSWVKKDHLYKVKHFAESLNSGEMAITITDSKNEEIHPSDSMWSFRSERFELFNIYLN